MWGAILKGVIWAAKVFGIYAVSAGYNKYRQDKANRNNRSIVYKNAPANENIDREAPIPIVYGKCRVPGMLIYQEDTEVQNDSYDAAYAFCEGEVSSVDNIEINGVPVGDISTATATTYTGTATQNGDAIFSVGLFRVYAKQDAYTSEASPDTNYSTTDPNYLQLKGANGDDKRIYLQFDLSAYPPDLTVSSAMITMWGWDRTTAGRVAAYVGGDETLDEDTVTWNTQPATGAIASDYPNITTDRSYQLLKFNAAGLAFLQTQYDAATTATFVVQPYTNHLGQISYTSKESSNPTPYLIMRYTGGTACGYRNTAYAAVHLDPAHEKIGTANPTITALVEGRKITVWDESAGEYVCEYSRNPAWQLFDLYTNSRYGAGISSADIDDATFKTVASYCDAAVTDDDGNSVARYTCDVVIDAGADGFEAENMILRTFGGYRYTNNGKICIGVEKAPATLETTAGLLLNASLEESTVTLGSEMITNGDMELDSDWPSFNAPTVNERSIEQKYAGTYSRKITTSGADAAEGIRQNLVFTDGTTYKATYKAYNVAGGSYIQIANFGSALSSGTGSWIDVSCIGRANGGYAGVIVYKAIVAVETFYADDVSVKEYYLLDASPSARHLWPANQPTWNTLDSGLKVMNFNGTTSLIDTGSDWIDVAAVSLCIWMRPETAGEGSAGHIWCNGKLIVAIDNTNARISVTSDGEGTTVYSGNTAWVADTFNMLTVTRTAAGVANIYINGYLSGTADQASGTPASGTTNVFIGNRSAADRTFDGDLSLAVALNGIVTAREAYYLYKNTKADYGL